MQQQYERKRGIKLKIMESFLLHGAMDAIFAKMKQISNVLKYR
jgi:hypothetical protein